MLSQRGISNCCIPVDEGELQRTKRQTLGCAKQKDETQLSSWTLQLAMKKKILHSGQALQQAAQRYCGISLFGNIQNMTEKALCKLTQPFKDCLEMEIGLDDLPRQNPVTML